MAEATPVNSRIPEIPGEGLGGPGGLIHPLLGAGEEVQKQRAPTILSGCAVTPALKFGKHLLRGPITTSQPLGYPTAPSQQLQVLLRDTNSPRKCRPRFWGREDRQLRAGSAAPVGARCGQAGGTGAGPAARFVQSGPSAGGGWTSAAPALPRTGTPPRRLLGVTPCSHSPRFWGWPAGRRGTGTPVCPGRGAAHGTRAQSSAGRVRAQAPLRPPGRAAPSGEPASPSRVLPGGPAVPFPFPFPFPRSSGPAAPGRSPSQGQAARGAHLAGGHGPGCGRPRSSPSLLLSTACCVGPAGSAGRQGGGEAGSEPPRPPAPRPPVPVRRCVASLLGPRVSVYILRAPAHGPAAPARVPQVPLTGRQRARPSQPPTRPRLN